MKIDRWILLSLFSSLIFQLQVYSKEVPKISRESILIGQSAAFQGASSALGQELWKGAHAYFAQVNESGGVNGAKIIVRALDDSYNADKTVENTIKLVREENVFALFGYVGTPTIVRALPAIHKFHKEKDMFLFSNFTGAQPQREAPYNQFVYNVRSSYRQETAGLVNHLLELGIKKIGVFAQNDSYGRSGIDGVARALKQHGLKVFAEATYERGAVFEQSMKAQVDILKDSEAIISIGSYNGCAAFIRDLRQDGYKGLVANVSFVGADALLARLKSGEQALKVSLTEKLINSQVVPLWSDESYPLVAEYKKAMDKYKPEVPVELGGESKSASQYSFGSLEGYLNAKVFVEILKRMPNKDFTRANFFRAADSVSALDVGMKSLIGFSTQDHQGSDAVFYTTVKDGQYVEIKDWKSL